MKKKIIALCTPSLGAVSLLWARAVASMVWPLNIGHAFHFEIDHVGGENAEIRNRIVMQGLSRNTDTAEVDSFLWLDDDVIPTPYAMVKLYGHHAPIVSGVYFTKTDPSEPLLFPGPAAGTVKFVPDQVQEMWGHGMGLCLVKADVYLQMAQQLKLPPDKYGSVQWYKDSRDEHTEGTDGAIDCGATDDLFFLGNARKCGIKSVIDTGKWAFGFHYDLARRQGYPLAQWKQFDAGARVTWPQADGTAVEW